MSLTFITGGARSGKSRLAIQLASAAANPVTFIATGEAIDAEMTQRISRHQADRPSHWVTIEVPRELGAAVRSVPVDSTLIVDCLTLWVNNLMFAGLASDVILESADDLADAIATREALTIVVTNEVGSGIVPGTPIGREYQDVLGGVNSRISRGARTAYLAVAGRAISLLAFADVVGFERIDS